MLQIVVAIRNQCNNGYSFSFNEVEKKKKKRKETEHFICKLDVKKTSQSSNVPINVVKESIDIFSDFLCTNYNSSVNAAKFLKVLNCQV